MPDYLDTPQGRRIAYHRLAGKTPGLVFLGGFKSDMEGTKAVHLEAWAKAQGRAFLRFDYSGHGASSGAFTDGAISDWAEDAEAAITALTTGPQILVGSSMGGLIEDGRSQLVLRDPLPLPFPTRFLQGTDDADVDMSVALRLLEHATGDDMRLVLLKGGDHRFSDAAALELIENAINNVLEAL